MILKNLENIKNLTNMTNSPYINLLGDKAYKLKEKIGKQNINNKKIKINMITPDKINTKIKQSNYKKSLLKNRIKIENTICILKKTERFYKRREKKILNFMSFVYISSLLNNISIERINND